MEQPKAHKKKAKWTGNIMDRIETCHTNGQYELDISHLELVDWPSEVNNVTRILPVLIFIMVYGYFRP